MVKRRGLPPVLLPPGGVVGLIARLRMLGGRGAWGRISLPRGGGTEGDRSIRLDIRTGILEEDSALPRQVVERCNPNGEHASHGGARPATPCRFQIVGFCTAGSTSFLWHAPPGAGERTYTNPHT